VLLEALLLASDEPVSEARLLAVLADHADRDALHVALGSLRQRLTARQSPMELTHSHGGWRLRLRAEFSPWLLRLHQQRPPQLPRALLEILTVVAYHQPITRAGIESERGVQVASAQLRQLEARGWLRVAGQEEGPGQPLLWATTAKFLDDLGLPNLQALPPLVPDEQPPSDDEAPLYPAQGGAVAEPGPQQQHDQVLPGLFGPDLLEQGADQLDGVDERQ